MKMFSVAVVMVACLVSCSLIGRDASTGPDLKCGVHGDKMEHVVLDCDEYADRKRPDGFHSARGEIFPHSGTEFPLCTFYPNRMTWRCPECARQCKAWGEKHLRHQPFL